MSVHTTHVPTLATPSQHGDALLDRLRTMVADHLGVEIEEVTPEASFADDLAADSLDMAELAVVIEAELGIPLPDAVRTFADLVRAARTPPTPDPPTTALRATHLHARLLPADDDRSASLERTLTLEPYDLMTLLHDVRHAPADARLEVRMSAATAARILSWSRRKIRMPFFTSVLTAR